jgi:hypothetical protein
MLSLCAIRRAIFIELFYNLQDPSLKLNSAADQTVKSMTLPRSPKLTPLIRKSRPNGSSNKAGEGMHAGKQKKQDEVLINLENIAPVDASQNSISTTDLATGTDRVTPGRKNALDLIDLFAFPFTPELQRKVKPVDVDMPNEVPLPVTTPVTFQPQPAQEVGAGEDPTLNALRRETFVVDDETQVNEIPLLRLHQAQLLLVLVICLCVIVRIYQASCLKHLAHLFTLAEGFNTSSASIHCFGFILHCIVNCSVPPENEVGLGLSVATGAVKITKYRMENFKP